MLLTGLFVYKLGRDTRGQRLHKASLPLPRLPPAHRDGAQVPLGLQEARESVGLATEMQGCSR